MFVKIPKLSNIIRVPMNFITLDKIHANGDLSFTISYHINQSDIVQKNALTCRLTAMTRVTQQTNVLPPKANPVSQNRMMIRNILALTSATRATVTNQENFIIATKLVDNTSALNNEIIGNLRKRHPLSSINALHKRKVVVKSVNELNASNNMQPVLQVNSNQPEDVSENIQPTRHVFQTNLIRHAIDPTHFYDLEENSLTPDEAINGTSAKGSRRHVDRLGGRYPDLVNVIKNLRFVNHPSIVSTLGIPDDTKIVTLSTEVTDQIEIETSMRLPAAKLQESNGDFKPLIMQFDLLDNLGVTIQSAQQTVSVIEHIDIFKTPKIAPIVKLAKFDTTTLGNIQVRQLDPQAKSVRIFKKSFFYAVNDIDSYSPVDDYDISVNDKFVSIPVDVSARCTTIFRVVPVGEHGTLSAEFTNVIVKPSFPIKKLTSVSLTTKIVDVGVNIEIREVPADVVAVRVARRDDTINEVLFSTIGDDNLQVNPHDETTVYIVTDTSAQDGHLYEYVCKLIYRNGTTTQSGNAILEYQSLAESAVDTKIENLEVSHDINNLDVKFDIVTEVTETNIDAIKTLLQNQGIEDQFSGDIIADRANLQKLIAHSIQRINLTTGIREDFGTVTSTSFSDVQLRVVNSVLPLKQGQNYRYEVVALLRATETLLTQLSKTVVDPVTHKSFTFSPAKFLHPITLTLGNITSPATLAAHYPKSQMAFGSVGNLAQTEVSFSDDVNSVIDASAENFDKHYDLVKWRISGNSDDIDHFMIMKEHLGQRHIVGKSHASFDNTAFTFIYTRKPGDVGELFFVIIPVYNTYSVGNEVKTNGITLDE